MLKKTRHSAFSAKLPSSVPVQPQVTPHYAYSGVKHVDASDEIEAKYSVTSSKELVDLVAALEKTNRYDGIAVRHDERTKKKLARYRVVTVYYDTRRLALRKHGYVVRFRFRNIKHGYDNHFSIKYRDDRSDKFVDYLDQIMCRPEVDIALREDEPELDLKHLSQIPDRKLRRQLLKIIDGQQLHPMFLTDVTRSKFDIDVAVSIGRKKYVVQMEFAADECFYYGLRPQQKLFPLYPHIRFEGPQQSSQIIVGDIKYGKVNGLFLNYEPQFEIEIKGAKCAGRPIKIADSKLKYALAKQATLKIIAYIQHACPGITVTESFLSKADSGFDYLQQSRHKQKR